MKDAYTKTMMNSSNTLYYFSAAILAVLTACMFNPSPVKGQNQTQAGDQTQAQDTTQARAQKPWKDLPPEQFHRIMQANPEAMVIDTRMLPKYERERIPGARPAPYSEELKALTDTLSRQRTLLVYCGYDDRSPAVCELLTKEMGFVNVFRLKGGLYRWKKQNLPLDESSLEAGS